MSTLTGAAATTSTLSESRVAMNAPVLAAPESNAPTSPPTNAGLAQLCLRPDASVDLGELDDFAEGAEGGVGAEGAAGGTGGAEGDDPHVGDVADDIGVVGALAGTPKPLNESAPPRDQGAVVSSIGTQVLGRFHHSVIRTGSPSQIVNPSQSLTPKLKQKNSATKPASTDRPPRRRGTQGPQKVVNKLVVNKLLVDQFVVAGRVRDRGIIHVFCHAATSPEQQ